MNKCCSFLIESLNLKKCLKCNIHNDEEQDSLKSKECKTIIIQRSSTNGFNLQGDFTKLENYDLFKEFLKIPLVQTYIEEVFRPNKEIKSFQLEKINGIFKKIEKLLYKLFKRLNIELNIPTSKFYLRTSSFDLMGEPATKSDLDCYTPLLFMEFWIYGKSFIKKSRLKKLNLVHNIEYTNSEYTQERAGCPEYDESKSITYAIHERNLAYIRIVLHHELFHYIDYSDDFSYDDDGWEKLNQKGFEYGEGGDSEREWIKLEKNQIGFINHYSTSALAEDRAEIYQYLISCPDEALNNNDKIVSKKAKRIQDFLNEYDNNGMGNEKNNFWANLIDYRQKYVYKEKVFQGNIFH
jgi:hypothetical protein